MDISDEELSSLNRAILTRYDVDFTCYETNSLKRRVSRAISVFQLGSVHNLWIKLLKDREFIYPFIDELTVGMTAMFRDPILWRFLRDDVLPSLAHKEQIKILHAGCSTGEEVYSMGILLQELDLQSKTKALAIDLNSRSITSAKSAQILKMKMSENERNYKSYYSKGSFSDYYEELPNNYVQMNKGLIRHVEFNEHNLVSEDFKEEYDLILCRNVMIYFDQKMKIKLLSKFHNSLSPNGFFSVGFFDSLVPLIDETLFDFYDLSAKVFQKKM